MLRHWCAIPSYTDTSRLSRLNCDALCLHVLRRGDSPVAINR